ncbi:MAG: hypothetical protein WCL21_13780 [Mariniphaga sp.]
MTLLYLDPGTGSLMIQFVIAAVSGILIFFKQIKIKIKAAYYFLVNKKPEDKE